MSNDRVENYLLDQIADKDAEIERLQGQMAEAWDAGFDGLRFEMEEQAKDPSYPIHRPNPYRGDTNA